MNKSGIHLPQDFMKKPPSTQEVLAAQGMAIANVRNSVQMMTRYVLAAMIATKIPVSEIAAIMHNKELNTAFLTSLAIEEQKIIKQKAEDESKSDVPPSPSSDESASATEPGTVPGAVPADPKVDGGNDGK